MKTLITALGLVCAPVVAQEQATPPPKQVDWVELGPAPIATGPFTGRVSAIACSATNHNRYYVGGADGGVWRSDNGGSSWIAVGDALPTTAIGALAVDPGDDDVIYAGLGEANFAHHSRYGMGFARSRDAGRSWTLTGESKFAGRCFSRIRVHPADTSILFAATAHAGGFPAKEAARDHPLRNGPIGVFRSTDHGSTWTQLSSGLPAILSATDIALDPYDPDIVYAAIGDIFGDVANGIYKSMDGGDSFAKLGGFPGAGVGRLTVALVPSDQGTVVHVSAVNASNALGENASTRGVYRSADGGATWSSMDAPSHHATYGWYLSTCVASPRDPGTLIVGGLTCHRTVDAGATWSTVTPPHVDLHALEFDADERLLCGNDGGVHRSDDLGSSWSTLNNDLGLIQFYAGISLDPNDPAVVYGGTQDNGSVVRSGSGNAWTRILGGDGGHTGIDSTGTRIFVEYQGTGNLYRSLGGSATWWSGIGLTGRNCFLPPFDIHPSDSLRMIYGTERLWHSADGGTLWSPVGPDDLTKGGSAAICGLAWAASDVGTIYVLTNDGQVQVSRDEGVSWTLSHSGVPTWSRTRRPFAVHPADPEWAFLALASFGSSKILATENAGESWFAIAGDLPDIPANSVALHVPSGSQPILYVGTDRGVWRSDNSGRHWYRYGARLPNAPVIDLRVDTDNDRIVAATQGRGLWQAPLSLRVEPTVHGQRSDRRPR